MNKYSDKPLDFLQLTSPEYLVKAHQVACISKRHKAQVINFEHDLAQNIFALSKRLREGTYRVSKYNTFYVYEPKQREIQALSYVDRVVQHTVCDNYLTPYFKNRLLVCNCACQVGKGTHYARKMLKDFIVKFLRQHSDGKGFFLKCDISKYFDNINHDVLKTMLQRLPDKDVYKLLCYIIDSYQKYPNAGLPIGNQTSQIFGVVYLDPLDRFIKEKLHIKFYLRYMDDLILLHEDREYLKFCKEQIISKLAELKLSANKKTVISPLRVGIEFLGMNYNVRGKKVMLKMRRQSITRMRNTFSSMFYLHSKGKISYDKVLNSLAGLKGHLTQI